MSSIFSGNTTRSAELGVGSVRDAFADMLVPGYEHDRDPRGTFLLPVAYQRRERLRVRSAELAAGAAGGTKPR
jgi:hypothetical protein